MPVQRTFLMILVVLTLTCTAAHAMGLEVALGGWQQDPGGDLGYKALTSNDLLDVDRDLKYDTKNQLLGRAKIELPSLLPNIYLMAAPTQFEATGQKAADFTFGDSTIHANTAFYSKLTYNQYDVGLYYGLPFLKTATAGILNVDLGLDARILQMEAILSQGTDIYEKHDRTIGVPLIFASVQVTPLKWLAIEAEGLGITYSGNNLYTVIGRARFNVFGPAFIAAGYRYDKVDVDEQDVKVNLTIQGPFAEVGLKF